MVGGLTYREGLYIAEHLCQTGRTVSDDLLCQVQPGGVNVPSHLCRSPVSGGHGGGESSTGSDGGRRPVHRPHGPGPAARLFRASPRGKPPVRLQAAGALTGATLSTPSGPERLSDDHR